MDKNKGVKKKIQPCLPFLFLHFPSFLCLYFPPFLPKEKKRIPAKSYNVFKLKTLCFHLVLSHQS